MFITFFTLLRAHGLNVSLGEWLTLMDALDNGLADSELKSFYYLCRSILTCSEADYDKLDCAFGEYFGGIAAKEDLPEKFWDWLENDGAERDMAALDKDRIYDIDEIRKMFEERKEEQDERHDYGSHWIGTKGRSPFGNAGFREQGFRVGGESRHSRALQIVGERKFRDFRQDKVLETRQFEVALKRLRQYSLRLDVQKTELDIDATVSNTSKNAGLLSLTFAKPRKNAVKLLVLFDSDGSMLRHTKLTSRLFKAADNANHFKDVRFYYFHNCIYEKLYTSPRCRRGEWVDTEYVFKNLDGDYKVIFVGDAAMAPSELMRKGGNVSIGLYNEVPGVEWLLRFKKQYKRCVWFNPIPASAWDRVYGHTTIGMIGDIFPMFALSVDGLTAGIKSLLMNR